MNIGNGLGQFSQNHLHWLIFTTDYTSKPSDSISLVDILSKGLNKFLNEGVTISESITRNVTKGISDTITIAETIKKDLSKVVSDSITSSEPFLFAQKNQKVPVQLDEISITDSIKNAITKIISVSDSFIINELSGKGISKAISDASTINDSIIPLKGFGQTLIDTLLLGDQTSRNLGKLLQDNVSITDNIKQTIMKEISDGVQFSEILLTQVESILLEQSRIIRPKSPNGISAEGGIINR